MVPKTEDFVFYVGEHYRVEFYFSEKGRMFAKEYFQDSDSQVQVKLLALVKYISENGRLYDENKFRLVDKHEKLYEFKPKHDRFFSFFHEGKKIIITHAYHKKTQKVDGQELARAIKYKRDYEQRVKEGSYYENK